MNNSPRYFRKIIRIRATDSPNVRLALAQIAKGVGPTGEVVLPGVLTYAEYEKRRRLWDKEQQCVGLDAEFYEGAEILLFPPDWLTHSARYAASLRGRTRKAKAIGIDPAEGGDSTAMAAVDELGLIELVSRKTPDTSVITGEALAFMRRHNVPPECVAFDRGGGGKQHADTLRQQGYAVRTVAFGETVTQEPKRGRRRLQEQVETREERYAYFNRRAEMYGELSTLLDPTGPGFGLPAEYVQLRQQLSPIPKLYDREGRLRLPPKNKRDSSSNEVCLVDLIGHSPDEADALVLAVYAMQHPQRTIVVGAM